VIQRTYGEAKISPPESVGWNCHGTGTALGDPIEVGAVRRIHIKEERSSPLLIETNKTHTGHLEGGAAMTSLIGCALQLKFCTSIPINHFYILNPNLEQSQFDAIINELPHSFGRTSANCHVSSFGFGWFFVTFSVRQVVEGKLSEKGWIGNSTTVVQTITE